MDGYFRHLEQVLGPDVRLIKFDPPGLEPDAGRRWLTLSDHAAWLAKAIRQDVTGPVVIIGHSLGGLVALRLALAEPELVGGLLLLDPSPPIFAAVLPRPLLKPIALFRKCLTLTRFGPPRSSHATPPAPRAVPLWVRIRWYVVFGGSALAADIAGGGLANLPTIIVSAAEHRAASIVRRTHQRLTDWIPNATLEVWANTTHAIHPEQPEKVAESALALLRRAARPPR